MKETKEHIHYARPVRIDASKGAMLLNPDAEVIPAFLQDIRAALDEAKPGTVVPISLEDVELSASCHAAVLAPVIEDIVTGRYKSRFIVALDPSGKNAWDADAALLKESERLRHKLVCVWRGPDEEVELLGPVDEQVRVTYAFATQRWKAGEGATARDYADHLGLSIQAASNRMSKAARLGIIYRSKRESARGGGAQHVYVPVQ